MNSSMIEQGRPEHFNGAIMVREYREREREREREDRREEMIHRWKESHPCSFLTLAFSFSI